MPLHTHGRRRRRLRLRPPEEDEDDPLSILGDEAAGIPPQHRDTGGRPSRSRAGGDGQPRDPNAGGPGGSEPGPRLELERVDVAGSRPELDRRALERNRWLAIASAALSGMGALTDSPGLAKAGEGLTEGFAQGNRRRRKAFMEELADFQERRQAARQENRARERVEAEAEFEVDKAEYEAEQEKELMEAELQNALDKIDRRYDRKLELIREEEDREPTKWEKMQIEAEKKKAQADLIEAQREKEEAQSGGADGDGPVLPDTMEGVESQLRYWRDLLEKGIQETNTFGEPYRRRPNDDELERIQRNINLLKRRKRQLREGGSAGQTETDAGRGDGAATSETGRSPGDGSPTPPNTPAGADTAATAVERSRRARQAAGDTTKTSTTDGSAQDGSGTSDVVQNERTARLRSDLAEALETNTSPDRVMNLARQARKAGALTPSEFRKIRAHYGQ